MAKVSPTSYLAAVGAVASTWAGFELSLDMSAIMLARIPQQIGLCFTAQIAGPARKLDAYIAIARLRGADNDLVRDLNELAKDTASLAERRNRVVHDPWFFFTEGASPGRLEITAKRVLRHRYVEVGEDVILRLVADIDSHIAKFAILHARIGAAIDT
jgi:hypothetical protein